MTRTLRSFLIVAALALFPASFENAAPALQCANAAASCGDCPPLYCEDKAAAKKAKDKKANAAISQGLPRRLAQLFYQLPDCVGCVKFAPDWVTIAWEIDVDAMEKLKGGKVKYTRHWQPWSAELEWKLRQQMQQGLIKEVHFMVHGGARCRCCKPGEYKNFRYKIGQDAKDKRKVYKGGSVAGYNTDFEYYKPYGKRLTNPGDYPKDLNEVPEGLRSPNEVKMPKLRMGPAERSITQPCPACRKQAEDYNDAVHAINDLRRPLAKAEQVAGFYSKIVTYAWREYSATQYIADPAARDKAEAKALGMYRIRMKQWEDAKRELKELQEKDKRLRASLKPLFAALLACEERCKRPEPKTDNVIGDDFEIELEDARTTDGVNAFNPGKVEEVGRGGAMEFERKNAVVNSGPKTSSGRQDMPEIITTVPATPAAPTPFTASAQGTISFAHTVGGSPCPQAAGTVNFQGNKGPVEIVSATASGSIQPKLTLSPQGSRLVATFNCSSPANGRFTGSVRVTLRDKGTGETTSVTLQASGTVTGG